MGLEKGVRQRVASHVLIHGVLFQLGALLSEKRRQDKAKYELEFLRETLQGLPCRRKARRNSMIGTSRYRRLAKG